MNASTIVIITIVLASGIFVISLRNIRNRRR
jgi:hypothetical protein